MWSVRTLHVLLVTLSLVSAPGALAEAVERVPGTVGPSGRTITLPARAVEVTPGIFDLGTTAEGLQGYAIVDYQRDGVRQHAKPSGGGSCFSFLARGARWKATESYLVDPTNTDGLSAEFVRSTLATGTETWDSQVAFDVFGPEVSGVVDGADMTAPDGKNEVLFGNIASPGAVAVTIVWGIFGGPTRNRVLTEWDQVYDDADFDFGDATISGAAVMDLLNVGVHEVGHAGGLGHPSDSCAEESMFRFVSLGETKKRDLNAGDIAGVRALYP